VSSTCASSLGGRVVAQLGGDRLRAFERATARPDAGVAPTIAEHLVPLPYGMEIALVRDLIIAGGQQTLPGAGSTVSGCAPTRSMPTLR
jgi:hypothetical protein